MIPTLVGISILVFSLIHLAPGDPASFLVGGQGGDATVGGNYDAAVKKFEERFLLDRALPIQYLHYVGPFNLGKDGHAWFGGDGSDPWGGLLVGDLGSEFGRPNVQISKELWKRLLVTTPLAIVSVMISYLIAIPIGIYSAVRRGTRLDLATTVSLFLLYALPNFWAGLMLQLIFGRTGFDVLPVIGLFDKDVDTFTMGERIWDLGKHVILPIACMSYGSFAYLSRQMRVGMIDVIQQDYIRTARAKGLPERTVVLKHALRNSVIPILTLLASILPILIGGSIIIESVFDIPGMGKYAFEGLVSREYNVIMATTLFSALMTVVGILLSDLTYALVDPRIRYD